MNHKKELLWSLWLNPKPLNRWPLGGVVVPLWSYMHLCVVHVAGTRNPSKP